MTNCHSRSKQLFMGITIFCTTLLLFACSSDAAIQKATPREDDVFARQFIAQLNRGNIAEAKRALIPAIPAAQADAGLQQIADILHGRQADSMRVVNVQWVMGENKVTDLTYEIRYRDSWVLADIQILDSANTRQIIGAHAKEISSTVLEQNALTLRGKSAIYYLFLICALAALLFSLYTCVTVIRSKMPRRWLWALLALIGLIQFTLNWTTGETSLQLIRVQLLCASIFRPGGPYVPWFFSFSLPLGALVSLVRLSDWRRKRNQATEDQMTAVEPA